MKSFRIPALALLATACLAPTQASAQNLDQLIAIIPAGTGYASLDLCTRTNVSGDEFARVRDVYTAPMIQPLPSLWTIFNNPGKKVTVTAAGVLYPRIGVYRPGMGCTVVKNVFDEFSLRAQPFKAVATPPASNAPWPAGEGTADKSLLSSAQLATLDGHANSLFSTASGPQKSTPYAFLVASKGRLVYERYASGYTRDQRQIGWSMTKSLTALTAGLMEREGKLGRAGVDEPVGLKKWAGTDKAAITWRQLLNHASGLKWDESETASPNDVYEMLFNNSDDAAYAANKPLAYPPGTHFTYSTGAQTIAMAAMKEKLGGTHQGIYDYYQSRLFAPLGIRNGMVEPDFSGTPIGGARGVLRPVDWARLGQLVANGGTWNGQTLLSPAWVKYMVTPSPSNPAYAGSIWTKDWEDIPADIRARLPADTVFFSGLLGQYVVIVPSRKLVVTHMGVSFDHLATVAQVFSNVADLVEQGL